MSRHLACVVAVCLALVAVPAEAARKVFYYNANVVPYPKASDPTPFNTMMLGFMHLAPAYTAEGVLFLGDLISTDNQCGYGKVCYGLVNEPYWKGLNDKGIETWISFGGGTVNTDDYKQYAGKEKELAAMMSLTIERVEKTNGITITGIDLDYEDSQALGYNGGGQWIPYNGTSFLVNLSTEIKKLTPNGHKLLLSHAPQPPFLCTPSLIKNAPPTGTPPFGADSCNSSTGEKGHGQGVTSYIRVMNELRELQVHVEFLQVQYYDNGDLFGTAKNVVSHYEELVATSGISPAQLVVTKPVVPADCGGCSQALTPTDLADNVIKVLVAKYPNFGGVSFWQFSSDYKQNYEMMKAVSAALPGK
jgi:hypothetical protein